MTERRCSHGFLEDLCVLPSCDHFDGKPSPFMRELPAPAAAPEPVPAAPESDEPSLHPRNVRTAARRCEHCGEAFRRRSTEAAATFAKRRFCGTACRDAANRAKCPPRTCECCGNTYERGPNEAAWSFLKRRFCSQTCARLAATRRSA